MTPAEVQKAWTERLRSGSVRQTKGRLGSADGSRCCLGVLCDLGVEAGLILAPWEVGKADALSFAGATGGLPEKIRIWAGLSNALGGHLCGNLSRANDAGCSFAYIAGVIESRPEGMFFDSGTDADP